MIQTVNGSAALESADAAFSKQDVHPSHPPKDRPQSGQNAGPSNTQSTPSVSLGGVLTQLAPDGAVQQAQSGSQSNATGQGPGALASVFV